MSKEQEFFNWLDEQEGYYIRKALVEEKFPNLEFDLFGATLKTDDDYNTLVPKPDLRHAARHGQPLD